MKSFVLDTNIIFSSLLKDSSTRKIILSDIFDLFAPEFLFTEIKKYEEIILKKSGIKKENFELLLLLLQSHIAVIPFSTFSEFLKEAEEEMEKIDIKDAPFIALALKLKIPVWSNDLHFKKQKKVESYTTDEIITNFFEIEMNGIRLKDDVPNVETE
ncbi:MAG: PIN domain-containing protein [Candidatus Aminicenantes bacterium]|jgi:predicted nucleic acid-binding protein